MRRKGVVGGGAHMPSCHGPSAREASMPGRGRRDLRATSPCQYCSSTTWSIGHAKGSGCDEAASGMAQSASRLVRVRARARVRVRVRVRVSPNPNPNPNLQNLSQ